MSKSTAPYADIGTIVKSTPEERLREGDRWVALRTLAHTSIPVSSIPSDAPNPASTARRPIFLPDIDRRHAQARQRAGL